MTINTDPWCNVGYGEGGYPVTLPQEPAQIREFDNQHTAWREFTEASVALFGLRVAHVDHLNTESRFDDSGVTSGYAINGTSVAGA